MLSPSLWGLDRERTRDVLTLALPIIGGMLSQNVLNLVDTAMVGRLGPASLAGVGMASFLNFMAVAFIAGLASAVQAMAARRTGEGRFFESALPLNGGLALSAMIGIPMAALLIWQAPNIMAAVMIDPAVVEEGSVYLQMRLLSMFAVGMNFSFRGYWSAIKMARLYLFTLLAMHALNIFLNYCLIFGNLGFPELGVKGAGLGTSIAIWIGTLTYFALGWKHARPSGFLEKWPSREQFSALLKLGLPSSIQQLFFSGGFTALYWVVGKVGTEELAVVNVLLNIALVSILPSMGFGLAAATLAGQALGQGDPHDAHRWPWDVSKVASIFLLALGIPMMVLPEAILSLFLPQPELVDMGRLALQLFGAGLILDGIGLILMQALLGVGAAKLVMAVSIGMQWLLFLPAVYLIGPVWGFGVTGIWLAMIGYRGLQAVVLAIVWERKHWVHIRV